MKIQAIPYSLLALAACIAPLQAQNESAVYPFKVTIGGHEAVMKDPAGVAAVIDEPVAPDAELSVDVPDAQTLIINALPTEDGQTPVDGAQTVVIMTQNSHSVKLNRTMDEKPLEPGKYLANVVATPPGKTSRVVFQIGGQPAADEEAEMPESFNLAMRRKATELIDQMGQYEKEIAETTGQDIDLRVEWAGFTEEGLNNLEQRGFQAVRDGLQAVAADDLGKQALGEKIQTIRFVSTDNDDWEKTGQISEDGVMLLEWEYGGMMAYNGDMIRQKLEKSL